MTTDGCGGGGGATITAGDGCAWAEKQPVLINATAASKMLVFITFLLILLI